jgi:hypothetical protein
MADVALLKSGTLGKLMVALYRVLLMEIFHFMFVTGNQIKSAVRSARSDIDYLGANCREL